MNLTANLVTPHTLEELKSALREDIELLNKLFSDVTKQEILDLPEFSISVGYVQTEVQELSDRIKLISDKLDTLIRILQ